MNDYQTLKTNVISAITKVAMRCDFILSATICGSFASSTKRRNISDIDVVVIVDALNDTKFQHMLLKLELTMGPIFTSKHYNFVSTPRWDH